jgi:hypothetical protein
MPRYLLMIANDEVATLENVWQWLASLNLIRF